MNILPTMLVIQAKDTRYKGCRFRSRLEARWAVFFDHVGIKYEYEYLDICVNDIRYLPDFWLPEFNCWIEIKPVRPTEEECKKAIMLCVATQKSVFMMVGSPWSPIARLEYFPLTPEKAVHQMRILEHVANDLKDHGTYLHWRSPSQVVLMNDASELLPKTGDWTGPDIIDMRYGFGCSSSWGFFKCAICGKVLLSDHTLAVFDHKHAYNEDIFRKHQADHPGYYYYPVDCCNYKALVDFTPAYDAARSARFEFGEQP